MRRLVLAAALIACASAPPPAPEKPVAVAPPAPPPPPPFTRTPMPAALPRPKAVTPVVQRATLPEGLQVVVVEQHRRPIVSMSMIFPHGSLSDPADNAGLTFMAVNLASDFYERMGVNDREGDERSFRRRVTMLGGTARFEVESDYSLVQIEGYAKDANAYMRMIWEAVGKPRHGHRSFEARRNAALDLFEELESEDPIALQQVIARSAFGREHPYARSLFGTTESLTTVELQEVMEQQETVFTPFGATLLVVGDVRAADVIAAARTTFEGWMGPNRPVERPAQPVVTRAPAEIDYLERRGASTLLTCAMRPIPEVRGTDPALRVLFAMLGHGIGSRLSMALREDNGLTYGVTADLVRRKWATAWIACSPIQAAQADRGLKLFREALEKSRETLPSDDELRRAKGLVLAQLESAWDDVPSATEEWIEALTVGAGTPRVDQERAEIEKVSAKDVQKVARIVLKQNTIRWVLSGDRKAAARAVEANKLGKLLPFAPGR